jgi:Asp-tRNA(Asn)/Glu-tRNA(Gln) amidotransferase A subunit family amidase
MRLTGAALKAARRLAESPWTRGTLWRAVSADFGLADLEALPHEMLGIVDEVPAPVRGAAPRAWGRGDDLGVPSSPRATGASVRDAYARGDLTPVDVLEALLKREDDADFGECTHSPFVALDRDGARAAAAASAARWARGEPLGPLDGLPVPIKDEFHVRGLPTRGGTTWRDQVVDDDAVLTTLLREAGAIVFAKSHATENGMNPHGMHDHFAMPRNAYSRDHGAGGSSTGSGAAVGLGLATVAVGTDGGGSIRIPAALNGVFGLKPTFNRFSSTGDIWRGSVGHTGPIGQSASDLVDLMEAATGRDPLCPMTWFATDWDHVRPTWRAAIGRGIAGCRIGVLVDELPDADAAIGRACERALAALEADGATLVDVRIPHLRVVNAIGPVVIAGESAANAASDLALHRHETGDELRLVYALMHAVGAQLFLHAARARSGLRRRAAAALAGVDVLALPTHAKLAASYPLAETGRNVAHTSWTAAMTRFNFFGNLTGLPAGTVPVGQHEGLPIGLQILGDAWDEASVLAVLAHVERLGIPHLPLPPRYLSLSAPA